MCDTRPRNEREDGAHEPKTENENGAAGSHEMREQHTFDSGREPSRERVHVAAVAETKPCGIEAGKRALKTSTNKILLTALWCSRVKNAFHCYIAFTATRCHSHVKLLLTYGKFFRNESLLV